MLFVVTRKHSTSLEPKILRRVLLIASPWILPLCTATAALSMNYIHPVSGNWCWIQPRPVYLRYALMHGWRFCFILVVLLIGLYVHLRLRFHAPTFSDRSRSETDVEVRKFMLLNSYAMYYIILWIPGIANRVAEAFGHSVRWLQVLQASTQFIGFANAITFGWHEVKTEFSKDKLMDMLLGFMLGE